MNIAEAKSIPLEEILGRYGHSPVARKGADLWYMSPFRAETVASFVVNTRKNVWYDHGEGQGGTVIDLVMRMSGEPNVGRVLGIVAGMVRGILPNPAQQKRAVESRAEAADGARVVRVADVSHPALTRYLTSRGVPVGLASRYLREVRYEVGGRAYFGLGFRNDAGGFEIRSERFKGCVGTKDMTTIPGEPNGVVNLFEGFVDFLSWPVLSGDDQTDGTTIVLNSVSHLGRAVRVLEGRTTTEIRCFFDNDDAGRKALARIREVFPDRAVTDMSAEYRESQDVNAELIRRRTRKAELAEGMKRREDPTRER